MLKEVVARRPIRIAGPFSSTSRFGSSSSIPATVSVREPLPGTGAPKGFLPKSEKDGIGRVAEAVFEDSGRTVKEEGRSELRDPKMLFPVDELMVGRGGMRRVFAKETP